MKNRFSPRIVAAALALSLGLAASSFAMPRGGPHHGPEMGRPGHHMMHDGRAMARLHDELKLDAKQEALWQQADKFGQENREAMRERFRSHHEEVRAMLDKPDADLRAVAKRMDDFRDQGQKQRDAVRDRWFAVYDSLSAGQKEKARLFFKDGFERMGRPGMDRPGRGQPPVERPAAPAPKG